MKVLLFTSRRCSNSDVLSEWIQGSHSWLVLRLIGFKDVRNYLGSWDQWANREDACVERQVTEINGFKAEEAVISSS